MSFELTDRGEGREGEGRGERERTGEEEEATNTSLSSGTEQSSPCDQDIMSGHEAAARDVTLVPPQSEREREVI